jgi:hypothetical protein
MELYIDEQAPGLLEALHQYNSALDRLERWLSARPKLVAGGCPYARSLIFDAIAALQTARHLYVLDNDEEMVVWVDRCIRFYELMLSQRPTPTHPCREGPAPVGAFACTDLHSSCTPAFFV